MSSGYSSDDGQRRDELSRWKLGIGEKSLELEKIGFDLLKMS